MPDQFQPLPSLEEYLLRAKETWKAISACGSTGLTLEQHLAQKKQEWTEINKLDPIAQQVYFEEQQKNTLPMLQSMLQKIDEEIARQKGTKKWPSQQKKKARKRVAKKKRRR